MHVATSNITPHTHERKKYFESHDFRETHKPTHRGCGGHVRIVTVAITCSVRVVGLCCEAAVLGQIGQILVGQFGCGALAPAGT